MKLCSPCGALAQHNPQSQPISGQLVPFLTLLVSESQLGLI